MNKATFPIDGSSAADDTIKLFGEVLVKEASSDEQQNTADLLLGSLATVDLL